MIGRVGFVPDLEAARLRREGWPPESVESYGKFGTRGSLLYPYINVPNGVRTPKGAGTLLQAFEDAAGRPGAMVAHLRPRAWIKEKGGRRAAAMFVPLEDVQPHGRGRDP